MKVREITICGTVSTHVRSQTFREGDPNSVLREGEKLFDLLGRG